MYHVERQAPGHGGAKIMNLHESMKSAAINFLNIADELNEQVSAFIDGSNEPEAENAYIAVLDAERQFCKLYGEYYCEPMPRPSLNYELAESCL